MVGEWPALQHGVCKLVCYRNQTKSAAACCMLHGSLIYAFIRAYGFALQDGDFHSNKGVIQYGLLQNFESIFKSAFKIYL